MEDFNEFYAGYHIKRHEYIDGKDNVQDLNLTKNGCMTMIGEDYDRYSIFDEMEFFCDAAEPRVLRMQKPGYPNSIAYEFISVDDKPVEKVPFYWNDAIKYVHSKESSAVKDEPFIDETSAAYSETVSAEDFDKDIKAYCDYEFNGSPNKTGNFRKMGETVADYARRTSDLLKKCPLWKKNFINEDGEYYPPTVVRENVCKDVLKMGTAMAHGAGVALKATAKGTGFVVGAGAAAAKTGIIAGYNKLLSKFPGHKKVVEKNASTAGWEYMAVKEYMNSATEYTQNKDLSPKEKAALLDTIKLTEGVRNAYYNRIGYEYYGVPEGKNAPAFLKKFLDRQCAANVDITSPEVVAKYEDMFMKEVSKCVKAGDMEAVKRLMPSYAEKPITQVLNEAQEQATKSNEQVAEEAATKAAEPVEPKKAQPDVKKAPAKEAATSKGKKGRTVVDTRTGETFEMTEEEAAEYDKLFSESPEDDDVLESAAAVAKQAATRKPAQVTAMPKKPSTKKRTKTSSKSKPLSGNAKKNALLGDTPKPIETTEYESGTDDGMSK